MGLIHIYKLRVFPDAWFVFIPLQKYVKKSNTWDAVS